MISLVTADNLNISGLLVASFTAGKVFCNVKTDIKASIKLISFKSVISISSDFFEMNRCRNYFVGRVCSNGYDSCHIH